MDRFTYVLKQDSENTPMKFYRQDELELMTAFQLRDICWKERLINGMQAPLDKDALIRQILRFRGRKDNLFIEKFDEKGMERIEKLLQSARVFRKSQPIKGCAKIVTYQDMEVTAYDGFSIGYLPELADTNALLVSGNQLCAIFQIRQMSGNTDKLYLTKPAKLCCQEAAVKNYQLYCMDRAQSDWVYHLYETGYGALPEHLDFYMLPVMDFQVRKLFDINMPLAIDFGTSNTTAGTYLDSGYLDRLEGDPICEKLRENDVNHVTWRNDEDEDDGDEVPIIPSVVGVMGIQGNDIRYVFGYQADRLFKMSYIDEGFCVFYDIKRWISDPDKQEELVDRNGHRCFVKRKEIIKVFLEYIISSATQRFKCRFKSLHISAPVKQQRLFIKLFQEILPDYEIEDRDMLDEGVAVLYNSISEMIAGKKYKQDEELRALIIDCGGGTTDLSSCRFSINNQRVSYNIQIATAYENGNTDFGGNNLTYRIMRFLKITLCWQLNFLKESEKGGGDIKPEEILERLGADIFRSVDEVGPDEVYRLLDEAYQRAEAAVPTRFKDYEHRSNSEYYAVKNNFYFLFDLAEQIKSTFFSKGDILRIAVGSVEIKETVTHCVMAERFKLSVCQDGYLQVLKDIPTVFISTNQISKLLCGDIYGVIKQFIEQPYESGELQEYSIMRLSGQSCKIHLFREGLKEFIPGRIIESSKQNREYTEEYGLKLMCLDGAIKYLKDKKFGYADVRIVNEQPAFPYVITAFTHTGEEHVLIKGLDRNQTWGYISRVITDLTIQFYLKDTGSRVRYKYNCSFDLSKFRLVEAETVVEMYRKRIVQDDIDSITKKELRSFVLADQERWGFLVVPVLRKEEQLMLGPEQFFLFETENWLTNFFDGTK